MNSRREKIEHDKQTPITLSDVNNIIGKDHWSDTLDSASVTLKDGFDEHVEVIMWNCRAKWKSQYNISHCAPQRLLNRKAGWW